ncbi:hypothetical protein LTR16_007742 [Cryomyces antarcticus]|uniref:Autophagy-related protein 101 n=1 Tax=Cryomyces antarcticus TaxID=329879 RepID=A0ABR0LUW7_9PEZI|nr:hypothetical protein LTR16_007742 [Cryomyces antarcticus]
MIEQRTTDLLRQIDSKSSYSNQSGRGQVAIFFAEKRRRKTYFQVKEEKTVWEQWLLNVTLATPRTETDVIKVRRAMEKSLQKAALKIIHIVNRDKDHIPPITTTDSNPFPYEIVVNPKSESWGQTLGIF